MKRRWHLALLAIAAVLLFGLVLAITAPDPAADAKDMPDLILRYAENQPEGYPTTEAAYAFADLVEEKTGGRVQIRVYSNGVLGSEDSVVEQMEYYGLYIKYYINLGSEVIKVIEKNDGVNIYEAGETVTAVMNPKDIMAYPADGKE